MSYLRIKKQNGLVEISNSQGMRVMRPTMEAALTAAMKAAEIASEDDEVIQSTYNAAQVLDSLVGEDESGQIGTGVQSA